MDRQPWPCPAWCQANDYPEWAVTHQGDSYFHRGASTVVVTTEDDHNFHPIEAQIFLEQQVIKDERGYNTRPIEVRVSNLFFTPANARVLAALFV